MRKILVMAALIIGVIGCGKDENSATGDYPEIVGTWRIVDSEVGGKRTSQIPNLTEADRQANHCINSSVFKFLANGDIRGVYYVSSVDPKKNNEKYYGFSSYAECYPLFDFDEAATEGSVKYKIREKKIIIYGKSNDGSSGEVEFFNIESLSGRTLKLSYSEEMKRGTRSTYERGKQFLQQHNLELPVDMNVFMNGFIIMEKQ
ncbi:hypothetical protein CGC58_01535 [Capnocytophaga stomatis]|uniref:Lipocalin-like domain-containing protein n=2 Tax=Capnocytophaga stomatis TaxID=1848904 RepID=A0A250FTV1_9FLAO|nr:hypothetical protein CGC58_01535 [Capnocytophaga stomatis]